uniref:Uncharacterized protein n=1 Tax=Rhizophora mucronata TaxID=61149 RepID=A0A2P2NIV8_RHIMU
MHCLETPFYQTQKDNSKHKNSQKALMAKMLAVIKTNLHSAYHCIEVLRHIII